MSADKVSFRHIPSGDDEYQLSASTVRSIFQDSFHNIWIGTYGGGINFISNNPPLFNTLNYNPVLGKNSKLSYKVAWGMCTDKQGKTWIGTDGGGINVFEKMLQIQVLSPLQYAVAFILKSILASNLDETSDGRKGKKTAA